MTSILVAKMCSRKIKLPNKKTSEPKRLRQNKIGPRQMMMKTTTMMRIASWNMKTATLSTFAGT